MLEKYLTHSADEFALLLRSTPNVTPEDLECFKKAEAYRYSKVCRQYIFNILLTDLRSPGTLSCAHNWMPSIHDYRAAVSLISRLEPQ